MDKRSYAVVVSPGKPADLASAKRIKILLTPGKKPNETKNLKISQAEIEAELAGLIFDDDDDIFSEVMWSWVASSSLVKLSLIKTRIS